MRMPGRRSLFTVLLAAVCYGAIAATAAAQGTAEERRQKRQAERAVEQKCSDYKRKYEEAEKAVGKAPRGQLQAALAKRDAALKNYCECLVYWCADAGIPLPAKYEQLCNPKPAEDPDVPVPDDLGVGAKPDIQDPAGPDTASPGGGGTTDACAKPERIVTLEDMEKVTKLPKHWQKELDDWRKAHPDCPKTGAAPGTGDQETSVGKPRPVTPPETGKKPGAGSTGGTPGSTPPEGAFNPAGPGSQPGGAIDQFFGDRTRQEFRGGAVFVTHSANHAAHCNVCLPVRDGVTVTFERSATPGAIQVTVTDPPLPPIACQERSGGGGFDCANVTASFCQMAPQATIAHLKLAPGEVQDMGVRLDYPGGEAFQFCTHGRTTP